MDQGVQANSEDWESQIYRWENSNWLQAAKKSAQASGGKDGSGGEQRTPPPDVGCKKCNKCRVVCPILEETKIFKSTNTGKVYKIKQNVNCTSDWVIYLSTCKKCRGQYVGKSKTSFKLRHSNHKMEIKNVKGGLGQHYGGRAGCGYANVSIAIIEQVKHKNLKFLAEREVYWQHQLRAFVENGGRAQCIRKYMWKLSPSLFMELI